MPGGDDRSYPWWRTAGQLEPDPARRSGHQRQRPAGAVLGDDVLPFRLGVDRLRWRGCGCSPGSCPHRPATQRGVPEPAASAARHRRPRDGRRRARAAGALRRRRRLARARGQTGQWGTEPFSARPAQAARARGWSGRRRPLVRPRRERRRRAGRRDRPRRAPTTTSRRPPPRSSTSRCCSRRAPGAAGASAPARPARPRSSHGSRGPSSCASTAGPSKPGAARRLRAPRLDPRFRLVRRRRMAGSGADAPALTGRKARASKIRVTTIGSTCSTGARADRALVGPAGPRASLARPLRRRMPVRRSRARCRPPRASARRRRPRRATRRCRRRRSARCRPRDRPLARVPGDDDPPRATPPSAAFQRSAVEIRVTIPSSCGGLAWQ